MENELNVNELDSVEGLFDDYTPTSDVAENSENETETEETAVEEEPTSESETVETEEVEAEAETETVNPFELKVKFNGEERTLTEEEARTLAQKGLNYDRFYEPIERLARMNNMSVGDYVNQLNDTQFNYEVGKEIESLRNDPRYENVNDDVLEELATSRVRDSMGQRDRNYEDQVKQQADAEQQRLQKEIDHFFEEYPEFRDKGPEALDPKVYEFCKQGYTLLEAYNKFQRLNVQKSQAEAKAKVSKLNEENKKKSLGNTTNAGKVESDDFLNGFLAD